MNVFALVFLIFVDGMPVKGDLGAFVDEVSCRAALAKVLAAAREQELAAWAECFPVKAPPPVKARTPKPAAGSSS